MVSSGSSPLPVAKPVGEMRRLSEKELQEKRSKGLCFRCDGKWSVGHKCQKKELSVLLTQDDCGGMKTLEQRRVGEAKKLEWGRLAIRRYH